MMGLVTTWLEARMPITLRALASPRAVCIVAVSPTFSPVLVAKPSLRRISPEFRSRISPARGMSVNSVAAALASVATTNSSWLASNTASDCSAAAVLTPGIWCTWSISAGWNPAVGPAVKSVCRMRSALSSLAKTSLRPALTDEAKTPAPVASVTPIISAAAVSAVRRGLRPVLRTPSLPGVAQSTSLPMVPVIGRLSAGATITAPMKTSRHPPPRVRALSSTVLVPLRMSSTTPIAMRMSPDPVKRSQRFVGSRRFAHRLDGRDAGGAQRRRERGEHRDEGADRTECR